VDCSPLPSAKAENDKILLVVAFMVCRERKKDLYKQSIAETNKLLLQLYSGKTLSAIVFDRGMARVCVCVCVCVFVCVCVQVFS
jgi:hypothetical protein